MYLGFFHLSKSTQSRQYNFANLKILIWVIPFSHPFLDLGNLARPFSPIIPGWKGLGF